MDTIGWLEAIGGDATLRYAGAGELSGALVEAQAPVALVAAVAEGDAARLDAEFGRRIMPSNHASQTGKEEGEEAGEGEPSLPQPPDPAPDQRPQ